MSAKFVTVAVADGIATVTLNNPPSNLLTTSVLKELDQAFGKLEADDAVRVIILTASGKFFSPGADIKELAELNTVHQGSELSGRGQALLNRVERFDKPVIAAINGACLGGGHPARPAGNQAGPHPRFRRDSTAPPHHRSVQSRRVDPDRRDRQLRGSADSWIGKSCGAS